jgi:hypothetical protein
MTTTTLSNITFSVDKPFEKIKTFSDYAEIVKEKSGDVEKYGLSTVIRERIKKGASELQKGMDKITTMVQY